jgi:hypothetical protein
MAIRKRGCIIRSAAIFAAAIAALICGTSRNALASAGCTAWNALRTMPGPTIYYTFISNWTAGEIISITSTSKNGIGNDERIFVNLPIFHVVAASGAGGTISHTITPGETPYAFAYGIFPDRLPFSFTFSCTTLTQQHQHH